MFVFVTMILLHFQVYVDVLQAYKLELVYKEYQDQLERIFFEIEDQVIQELSDDVEDY
jgi:hypothetical protein